MSNTDIHRVGRTARYNRSGKSLLVLTPEEEPGMMQALSRFNIAPKKIKINPAKQLQTTDALCSIMAKYPNIKNINSRLRLSRHPDIKVYALKAFVTYFKFVFMQQDKKIFNVQNLPAEQYAKSLGLVAHPVISILNVCFSECEKKLIVLQPSNSAQQNVDHLEQFEREASEEMEKEKRLQQRLQKLREEADREENPDKPKEKKTKLQKLIERKSILFFMILLASLRLCIRPTRKSTAEKYDRGRKRRRSTSNKGRTTSTSNCIYSLSFVYNLLISSSLE